MLSCENRRTAHPITCSATLNACDMLPFCECLARHAVLLLHIQWSACYDVPQVPAAILQIDVQPCGLGQVPVQDGNQCTACPSASYSFDPASGACKPCPAQGICNGGATLVPQQQHWHSAPDSDYIVTCPNSNACAGSASELLACQNATYQAQLDFTQV